MKHFERFDINNGECPKSKYPSQHWYGKKEIPNILLTVSNKILDEKEKHEIYFDQATQYYEEYDSKTGWKVIIELALMSPQVYELLTQFWSKYTIKTDNFWRSSETGKDEGFIEPEHSFNHFRIEHKLQCEGDPARWYITLWNNHEPVQYKEPIKLKEVNL